MPYKTIRDLPKKQTKGMTRQQKKAFKAAFNDAIYERGAGEGDAFKRAHGAAKRVNRRSS